MSAPICLTCRRSMAAADHAPDPTTYLALACTCGSLGHVVRFSHDPIDDQLYVHVSLDREPRWWRRALLAFRYVFSGHVCRYYDSAEVFVAQGDRAKLRAWVDAVPWPGGKEGA